MKNNLATLAIIAAAFFCTFANAEMRGQAISDGTSREKIKEALQQKLDVANVEVTGYSLAMNAYNPLTWAIDPFRKYRNIEITFNDKYGHKQTLSCQLNIVSGTSSATIHSCTGGMMSIGAYSKLAKYGYDAPSLILDGVVYVGKSTDSSGSASSSK